MPASVLSKAARGVMRRMRSANNEPKSSIAPEPTQASRPACQAATAGSGSPIACAASFAGSITRNTNANSETVLMP